MKSYTDERGLKMTVCAARKYAILHELASNVVLLVARSAFAWVLLLAISVDSLSGETFDTRSIDGGKPGIPGSVNVAANVATEVGQGYLVLREGEALTGTLVQSEKGESIRWLGDAFCDPFEFRQRALEKLVFSSGSGLNAGQGDEHQQDGTEFVFELQNGDSIRGSLVRWDRERLVVRHRMAGDLQFLSSDLKWVRHWRHLPEDPTTLNSDHRAIWRGFHDPVLTDDLSRFAGEGELVAGMNWALSGSVISSEIPGAKLIQDLPLPPRLFMNVELEWDRQPDFSLCLLEPDHSLDAQVSKGEEQVTDAKDKGGDSASGYACWRIECVGSDLVMVVEAGNDVDVRKLTSLDGKRGIRLAVYWDGEAGSMEVLAECGQSLGLVRRSVDPEERTNDSQDETESVPRGRLELENHSDSIRVRQFEAGTWNGSIARVSENLAAAKVGSMSTKGEGLVVGEVVGFDDQSGEIIFEDPSAKVLRFGVSTLLEFRRAPDENSSRTKPSSPRQLAVFELCDDSRLTGDIREIQADRFVIKSEAVSGLLELPFSAVRQVSFESSENVDLQEAVVVGRIGKFISAGSEISGRLVSEAALDPAQVSDDSGIGLSWHPLRSVVPSRIRRDLSAEIRFSDQSGKKTSDAGAKLLEQQRVRNQRLRRGLNFGQLFLERTDLSKQSAASLGSHLIHFRSGDVLRCRVHSIDETTVRVELESPGADGSVVSASSSATAGDADHAGGLVEDRNRLIEQRLIKAIEFVSNSPPPSLDQAKKQRLLTIPRLQKSDPPSHLLCSHNGDFLRCQLLEMDGDFFTVKVQLNQLRLPCERIAQLIWFHPDESGEEFESVESAEIETGDRLDSGVGIDADNPSNAIGSGLADEGRLSPNYSGLVQAVLNDGKRTTFTPTGLDGDLLKGSGQWVGECSFDLGRVDELLIGNAIISRVTDVAYNQWQFQAATEPLVAAVLEGDKSNAGQSDLVGQQVPNLPLRGLDGRSIKMSEYRGNWVLMNFWTTWSAASIKAVPTLEAIRQEYRKLGLIGLSVSVQESLETVRGAAEKYERSSTVLVDADGEFAQQFGVKVLPYVVLIDPEGKIDSVHLGGGEAMLSKVLEAVAQRLDASPQ